MTSLRWTNTTLFFSVFFQNTNIQGAGKEGQGGRRVSLDVLPSEKRTHSSYCQGREVRTSPRGREGRWGIVGIPSKLLILLRGLSGPERDPEFWSEMKPLSHAGRDPAEENEKLTWGGVPSTSPHWAHPPSPHCHVISITPGHMGEDTVLRGCGIGESSSPRSPDCGEEQLLCFGLVFLGSGVPPLTVFFLPILL